MTDQVMPIRRRDEDSDWHDLEQAACPNCGCTFYQAKDDPDWVWDPGRAWGEDCSDRGCACHEDPVIGRRRSEAVAERTS